MKSFSVIPLIVVFLFSACRNTAQEWPAKPAIVQLGEDSCAACKMIISQDNYGAQLHKRGEPVALFDDYGCLLARRPAGEADSIIYVRSFKDGSWLREDQAFYVVSKQIPSPMGYGIAGFATKESADLYAKSVNDSKVYSFSELRPENERIAHRHL